MSECPRTPLQQAIADGDITAVVDIVYQLQEEQSKSAAYSLAVSEIERLTAERACEYCDQPNCTCLHDCVAEVEELRAEIQQLKAEVEHERSIPRDPRTGVKEESSDGTQTNASEP